MRRQGHIRQRSTGSWELKVELPRDSATGRRRYRFQTVRGSQRDAQRELRRLLDQLDQGLAADAGKLTLGKYLDHWLAGHRATVTPLTAEGYTRLIERHIKPALGDKSLAKLSTLDLNRLYAAKLDRGRLDGTGGLSANMVHHIDRVLHVALRDAVRARLIPFNPVDDAKRPRLERVARRRLDAEEVKALLAAAEGGPVELPIVMILATGLRRGELLALRWRQVDLTAAVLFVLEALEETKAVGVRVKDVKTAAGRRRVDLPAFAVDALRDHRRVQREAHLALGIGWTSDTRVFPDPLGRLWRPSAFSRAVAQVASAAKVTFTPHLGRHDHFSRLLAAGCHPKVAQLRAGHSSIATTMDLYSHATAGLQREAIRRLENDFRTLGERFGGISVAKSLLKPDKDVINH
jgi:integrase